MKADWAAVSQSFAPKPPAAVFWLVTNWPAFQVCLNSHFNVREAAATLAPFLVPTHPARTTRHQHLTVDAFVTSGSFSAGGTNCLLRQQRSTGKSCGNRRRKTQTVKIVSDECYCFLSLNCTTFFHSFFPLFSDTCTDIYPDVFQVQFAKKEKKNVFCSQSQKCLLSTRQVEKKSKYAAGFPSALMCVFFWGVMHVTQ